MNASTNDELYDAAERVIAWSTQGLISESDVAQVEESIYDAVTPGGDEPEGAE